jgi:hypothetical protein
MIRRLSLTASSLLISAWKPRAMVSSTSSTGAPRVLEQQVWQLDLAGGHDRRAEQGLLVGEVAVHGKTPAAAATASMLVLA